MNSVLRLLFLEHGHWQLNARDDQALRELRAYARGHKFADYFTRVANSALPKYENILHGNHFAFHTRNFGDADNLAGAIAQAAYLNHHVNRRRNLPPNS